MAAPTYSWNSITAGQTDADSPLDTTLMEGIRQNLIHLEEWLGDGFTAAVDHDHDGVNSKTVVLGYEAGDFLIASADTENNLSNTSYEKKKEILIARGGVLRIKFDLRSPGLDIYGRIYRNGVAVGTEQIQSSGTYATFSEDISEWSAGDLLQLYVKVDGGTNNEYKNFRLYNVQPVAEEVILDS